MLLVLPTVVTFACTGAIGGNVSDVRLLYTNDDHCKCPIRS